MIQGASFLNLPAQAAFATAKATVPGSVQDATSLQDTKGEANVSSPLFAESILNTLNNSSDVRSRLLPLIVYLMQALLALGQASSQSDVTNPFSGQVASNIPPANKPVQESTHLQNADKLAVKPETITKTESNNIPKNIVGETKAEDTPQADKTAPAKPDETTTNNAKAADNDPPTTEPPNSVNVKKFGAVGDGKTDDQVALQKAIDEAKATGKSVWIPPGTYNHSGVLTIDGAKVNGAGKDTVLNATNPDQEAVKLTGNSPSLSNVKTTVLAPNRSSMPDAAAVLVQNASNASVTNVITQGAASNGIRLDNASSSHIAHNLILGSNADGIALMNGSSHNMISENVVYQAGDDSYSDDSYQSDAKQDEGNTFDGNLSLDNVYGRGITLAGSKNDTVQNNIVSGSRWIGIWGDSDLNSGTMDSIGHTIRNNRVINNPNGAPVQANGAGTQVSGTSTDGSIPSLVSILGWDPGNLPDRKSFNSIYTPGTGSGANNSGGVRT